MDNAPLATIGRFWLSVFLKPNFKKVLSNTWWLFADRVLRLVFGLTVGIWVARYLGPQQFGLLNYLTAVVAMFASIVPLGLDTIVVRELVQDSADAGDVLGTTFLLRAVAGVVVSVVAIAFVAVTPKTTSQIVLLTTILSLTVLPRAADVFDLCFQSRMQSKLTVTAKNAGTIIGNLGRILLIIRSGSLIGFCWVAAIESILGAVGLAFTYVLNGDSFRTWGFNWHLARRLLNESWPLILSSMAIVLYMRIDVVMLRTMAGDTATGIYAAATRVSEVFYFVPVAITTSVSPLIIGLRKSNEELYLHRMSQLLLALSLSLVTTFAAKFIVNALFGSIFSQAAPILAVHIWASAFVFLGVAQSPWDVSENAISYSLFRTIAGAIINIVMNLVLIPHLTGMGAAIATLVSYAVSGVFANALFAKTRPVFKLQMKALTLSGLRETYSR